MESISETATGSTSCYSGDFVLYWQGHPAVVHDSAPQAIAK